MKRFRLAVRLDGFSDFFNRLFRKIGRIREQSEMAEYGGASEVRISSHGQIVYSVFLKKNLQSLKLLMASMNYFHLVSISFDF